MRSDTALSNNLTHYLRKFWRASPLSSLGARIWVLGCRQAVARVRVVSRCARCPLRDEIEERLRTYLLQRLPDLEGVEVDHKLPTGDTFPWDLPGARF